MPFAPLPLLHSLATSCCWRPRARPWISSPTTERAVELLRRPSLACNAEAIGMSVTSPPQASTTRPSVMGSARAALARPLAPYYLVLGSTVMLTALGLVMVLSASSVESYASSGSSWVIGQRQALFAAVGVPLLVVASRLPTRWFRRLAFPLLVV